MASRIWMGCINKREMVQKNKNLIFFGILLFGILILNLFLGTSSISAETYCAETTNPLPGVGVMHCLDGLSLSEVNTNYRYDATSCQSTEYCQTGTCVDTISGKCTSSGQAACSPGNGGEFYTTPIENTPRCQNGCCFIGDQASFTTDAGCGVLASQAGVTKNFDPTITSESICITMARPQEKGACVLDTNNGRTCDFTTRQNCPTTGTFHAGFLCTNPTLGTNCVKSTQTTCLKTSSQVYFVDTCGNPANVYDKNKADDTNYWSYVAGSDIGISNGVVVDLGDNAGNIGSATNGNCNYALGSICASYDRTKDPVVVGLLGDNICRNVNCNIGTYSDLFKNEYGRAPYNGETWCGAATADSVKLTTGNPGISSTDFSTGYDTTKGGNLPGSTEVLFTCANGKITTEINAAYRSKVCVQTTDSAGYKGAGWQINLWQDCYYQNSSANCLDTNVRSCKWIVGASILKDDGGTPKVWDTEKDLLVPREDTKNFLGGKDFDKRQEASCAPSYPPGFDASVSQTDTSSQNICGLASRTCYVNYSVYAMGAIVTNYAGDLLQGTITCMNNDETVNADWAKNITNLCTSIGDCGISVNYIGKSGSNTEKDIFSVIKGNTSGIFK